MFLQNNLPVIMITMLTIGKGVPQGRENPGKKVMG